MQSGWDTSNTEALVRRIGESGWTDETFAAFEAVLGTIIRRGLAAYAGRFHDMSGGFSPLRRSRWIHVIEDTTSDLWIQLSTSLIPKYLDAVEQKGLECGFVAYLNGVIRLLLIDNARQAGLLPFHSVGELMRRYRRARKPSTRRQIVGLLKGRCQRAVRNEILARCPQRCFHDTYRNIHHIVDHFFEAYLPTAIRQPEHETANDLHGMIDEYVCSEMTRGYDYRSRICAIPQLHEVSLDGSEIDGEELLCRALVQRGQLP